MSRARAGAAMIDAARIVLVEPRNPLNIGAAARALSNFGFTRLRVVSPYSLAWREARSAVGAAHVLRDAEVFDTVAEAVADCSLVVGTASVGRRDLRLPVRRLEYGARLLRKHLATGPAAILFGSEKFGLSNDSLSLCHWLMRIPTRAEHESMNLGQAVAVCLYELVRRSATPAASVRQAPAASAAELGRLTGLLMELLAESGYSDPKTAGSTLLKLRRLTRRLVLTRPDSEVWMGMLRQIRWRLAHPRHAAKPVDR